MGKDLKASRWDVTIYVIYIIYYIYSDAPPEFVQNSRNIESFQRNYRMYKLVMTKSIYLYLSAICQFLHDNDVMIISRLWTNPALYMDMDFCILLGTDFWIAFNVISVSLVYTIHFINGFINSYVYFYLLPNSFYMFILIILSLSYPYMPYVSLNYVLCWCFVVMYINCIVVYGRTSCKTASGWWVILVKYVLIYIYICVCVCVCVCV